MQNLELTGKVLILSADGVAGSLMETIMSLFQEGIRDERIFD